MWTIKRAAKFFMGSIKKITKLPDVISIFNKDLIDDIVSVAMSEETKSITYGVKDILIGFSLYIWAGIIYQAAMLPLYLFLAPTQIIGTLISIVVRFAIGIVGTMSIYNHKEDWHHIAIKIGLGIAVLSTVIGVVRLIGAIIGIIGGLLGGILSLLIAIVSFVVILIQFLSSALVVNGFTK